MRSHAIDAEAITRLASAKGINSKRELARAAGISESVLHKGFGRGYLLPSHVNALAEALGVERDEILRTEVSA